MFIEELITYLKQHYSNVVLCRSEVGEHCIYIERNGVTLALVVFRIVEPSPRVT